VTRTHRSQARRKTAVSIRDRDDAEQKLRPRGSSIVHPTTSCGDVRTTDAFDGLDDLTGTGQRIHFPSRGPHPAFSTI